MDPTEEQIESLKAQLKQMNAADLSVLAALPESLRDQESVRLVTIAGSKNDLLWSEMAKLNWMKLDEPLEEHASSRVYVVFRDALQRIEALLDDLKRDELPRLFNELRQKIPALIAPPTIDAGGAPSDLALMLAGIIEATMRGWIRPELHEEFLQAVFDRVRDLGHSG